MPIDIVALTNGDIYKEITGTLASRIDYAWSVYTNEASQYRQEEQKKALHFLLYALDIRKTSDINQQLLQLMAERQAHKLTNPEYIPGKSPKSVPFDPRKTVPQPIPEHGHADNPEINKAIANRELLDVNLLSKKLDSSRDTRFLTADERAAYRVIISNGIFKKNGENFDTKQMTSHKKPGYAAYTLNANGELSVFDHLGGKNKILHSSMNAGSPVVAAGELKIEKGVLKAITTYSGHYQPSLFNVFRVLEHFTDHHIDISQASLITEDNPLKAVKGVQSKSSNYVGYRGMVYITPAIQIYETMNKLFSQNIATIQRQLALYKDNSTNPVLKFKDLLTGSKLTEQRMALATAFEKELKEFQGTVDKSASPAQLTLKIEELKILVLNYQEANKALSKAQGKDLSSGRLASTLSQFEKDLTQTKDTPQSMKGIY